jgi:hypothetical protein
LPCTPSVATVVAANGVLLDGLVRRSGAIAARSGEFAARDSQ